MMVFVEANDVCDVELATLGEGLEGAEGVRVRLKGRLSAR